MGEQFDVELIEEVPAPGTISTPVPGLIFADPMVWAQTLSTLEGHMVEVLLSDGESALGYMAGFADSPTDEDEIDLVLRTDWAEGPAGGRIAIPFHTIGLIQVL